MIKKIFVIVLTILSLFACKPKEQIELPDKLKIEEYIYSDSSASEVYDRHRSESGQRISGNVQSRVSLIELTLENGVKVVSRKLNDEIWQVDVFTDGKNVYRTNVANLSGVSGLVQAWSYDDHWALEIIPYPFSLESKADVILDGQSLRHASNYKEVFGFQLLAEKPFFFFRNDNGVGISYNGKESDVLYEDVLYRNYWTGYDQDPVQYENMVMFTAEKQKEQYRVLIGLFQE